MPAMPATTAHRAPVLPKHAYRLLNHGPTVLVSAAHGGQRNLMAAAWAMPLDFEPPKVAVVIDKSTFTRGLVEGSGGFALNLPCAAQADLAFTVGNTHGGPAGVGDKFAHYGIEAFEGSTPGLPLVAGCVAWLECRLLPEPHVQQAYDLFLGEVVAAQADERVFSQGRWHFDGHPGLRTLHHVAGGHFVLPQDAVQGRLIDRQHLHDTGGTPCT
jgi:flavin reductase (DIM6/NTAB) family NADH-FMN oxidoreductase RutF